MTSCCTAEQVRSAPGAAGCCGVEPLLRLVGLVGADRGRRAVPLGELRVHDPERRVRHDCRECSVRRRRAEHDGVLAGGGNPYAPEQERRIALEVDQSAEREDDVGGRHGSPVGEPDVAPELEGVRLRISRRLEALSCHRKRTRDVAALEGEQRVVDRAIDDGRGRLERSLRIGRPDLERAVDDERLGLHSADQADALKKAVAAATSVMPTARLALERTPSDMSVSLPWRSGLSAYPRMAHSRVAQPTGSKAPRAVHPAAGASTPPSGRARARRGQAPPTGSDRRRTGSAGESDIPEAVATDRAPRPAALPASFPSRRRGGRR